jgi:coproporphyrinogen III oxidase
MPERSDVRDVYREVQDSLCAALERVDGGSTFMVDEWDRPGGGGGVTRILAGDGHVEKAAVNFAAVEVDTPARLSESLAGSSSRFFATGLSVIVHPLNPHAPTFHANVRYFETDDGRAWFGGGADLTPHYLYEEDARHFHHTLAAVCERHGVADYELWKRQCDEYFHIPHRGEARGVGGIFFDHLSDHLADVWSFQEDLARRLEEAYLPILERRLGGGFGDAEREWQEIRRGRYAEFNLAWDRGTRFGLETSGRTESILASLPPRARWVYGHQPTPGSPEADLLDLLQGEPRSWV